MAVGANIYSGFAVNIIGECRSATCDDTGHSDALAAAIDATGITILTGLIEEAGKLEVAAGLDRGAATDRGLNCLVRGGLGLGTDAGTDNPPGGTDAVAIDAIAGQGYNFHILGSDTRSRANQGLHLGISPSGAKIGFG